MNTILILLGIIFGCGLLGAILQITFGDKRQTNIPSNVSFKSNQNDYSVLNENFKPTSKQDAINRINYLKTEQKELKSALDRHEKIIQESLNILYSSKNIDVIKRRFDTIYENHTYIKMYRDQGYDIKFDLDFINKLCIEYNKLILDLAKFKIDEYEIKYKSLKSEKAKDNQTKKIYELIDEIKHSFKNPTQEHHNEIKLLKNKIEDIYS
ncbi:MULTISPECIES: hypothetical protein [unclassified Empedobacter]|uniref:hypothetical protein n=1 Tax=unclassified Empedobacter TaxID=2643773 RepID=UPI0025B8AE42|nr:MULTISPECIES: hypothetical protein [unclassified Empedobacter]